MGVRGSPLEGLDRLTLAEAAPDPSRPAPSLRKQALRGSMLSLLEATVGNVLRLGSNLILTRLLFPEAFGIMALVNSILMGIHMVSDVGLRPVLINSERAEEPAFQQTMWTIGILRGALMTAIGAALAWPAAVFYGEPDLLYYLPVASLSALINGTKSVKWDLAQRRLDFARRTGIVIGVQVITIVTQVVLAWWTRSVWALVVGSLVSRGVHALLTHVLVPGRRDRLGWDRDAARDLIQMGKWIFASSLLAFLARRLDVLLLGKLLPIDVLGVYSLGLMLASLPSEVGKKAINSVLQPALAASIRKDPSRRRERAQEVRRPIAEVAGVPLLAVALLAPAFFEVLYDPRYHEAAAFTQLLVPSLWFSLLSAASVQTSLALGASQPLAVTNGVSLVATAAGCLGGYQLFGVPGFILGLTVGTLAGYLVIARALAEQGVRVYRMDFVATVQLAVFVGTGLLVPRVWAWLGGDPTLGTGLPVIATVSGVVILVPVALRSFRRARRLIRGRPGPVASAAAPA